MLRTNVQAVLESRNLSVTPAILDQLAEADINAAEAIEAALACRSAKDFLRLLRAATHKPGADRRLD